jgi:hypothetical protein
MSAQHREGFTDLSRSTGMIAHALGNVTYPTRNFARLLLSVSGKVGLYLESPLFIWAAILRICSIPSAVR